MHKIIAAELYKESYYTFEFFILSTLDMNHMPKLYPEIPAQYINLMHI